MEEVLSWTAFAPEAQQLEVVLPLLDELAERDLVELWRWQLGRPHSRPVVTGADRASPFAEAVRLLAGTLQRLGPEDGRSLWQAAGRRAPELDEEACLALLCAFLPQLAREQGPSAVTTLAQGFEEIVAEATRAALAARSARR
jgi:hypothetical protein